MTPPRTRSFLGARGPRSRNAAHNVSRAAMSQGAEMPRVSEPRAGDVAETHGFSAVSDQRFRATRVAMALVEVALRGRPCATACLAEGEAATCAWRWACDAQTRPPVAHAERGCHGLTLSQAAPPPRSRRHPPSISRGSVGAPADPSAACRAGRARASVLLQSPMQAPAVVGAPMTGPYRPPHARPRCREFRGRGRLPVEGG